MKIRKSYSIRKKIIIAKEDSRGSQREVSIKYQISRSNIYRWSKTISKLQEQKFKSVKRTLPYENREADNRLNGVSR